MYTFSFSLSRFPSQCLHPVPSFLDCPSQPPTPPSADTSSQVYVSACVCVCVCVCACVCVSVDDFHCNLCTFLMPACYLVYVTQVWHVGMSKANSSDGMWKMTRTARSMCKDTTRWIEDDYTEDDRLYFHTPDLYLLACLFLIAIIYMCELKTISTPEDSKHIPLTYPFTWIVCHFIHPVVVLLVLSQLHAMNSPWIKLCLFGSNVHDVYMELAFSKRVLFIEIGLFSSRQKRENKYRLTIEDFVLKVLPRCFYFQLRSLLSSVMISRL